MNTRVSRWSQEWLPSVIASAPAAKVSSQMLSVIPKPPVVFSPLMITQSSRQRSRRAGRRSAMAVRPGRPTISPRNRRRIQDTPEEFGTGGADTELGVDRSREAGGGPTLDDDRIEVETLLAAKILFDACCCSKTLRLADFMPGARPG